MRSFLIYGAISLPLYPPVRGTCDAFEASPDTLFFVGALTGATIGFIAEITKPEKEDERL